jgi:hypothetical protein
LLVGVFIQFTLPADYPGSVPPLMEMEVEKGLGKKHIEELREIINKTATENIGMPSVFTIAEAAREWLRDNNVAGQDGSMYADMVGRRYIPYRQRAGHITLMYFLEQMRRMQSKDTESKKKAAQGV